MRWAIYQTQRPTEQEVRAFWTHWPHANIAIATGPVSGMVVLDADSNEAISLVMNELGGLEDAPMVLTGKGRHWYLKAPESKTINFVGRWPHVDYRGTGGYALAPPSLHRNGHRYQWQAGEEVHVEYGPIPPWLNDVLTDGKKTVSGEAAAPNNGDLFSGSPSLLVMST